MSITVRGASILGVIAVLLVASGAQAVSLLPTNGTVTTFDVGSHQPVFEWDQSSEFQIVDDEVILFEHEIALSGCLSIVGTFYAFGIPNFYDPLPKKTVHISMEGSNTSGTELPIVLFIIGKDSPYGGPGPPVPVFGSQVSRVFESGLVTEAWEMLPNPDWEVVSIFVPSAFELQSIEIVTQSLPEPGTAALMAAGLFGLGLAGRRRR